MAKRKAETGKQKRSAKVAPEIRDRIRELRRVKAADLVPHPKNMQIHGDEQRAATEGILRELGYADALIVRELADGILQILDGHLRADITPEYEVPVLLVDLDDAEADLFLATHDPLARMAEIDPALQLELLRAADVKDQGAQGTIDLMLAQLEAGMKEPKGLSGKRSGRTRGKAGSGKRRAEYEVIVKCADQADQKALARELTEEGRVCRLLTWAGESEG